MSTALDVVSTGKCTSIDARTDETAKECVVIELLGKRLIVAALACLDHGEEDRLARRHAEHHRCGGHHFIVASNIAMAHRVGMGCAQR